MEESSYTGLPTSHLRGSVPAVIIEEGNTVKFEVPEANSQQFLPNNGTGKGRGYQTIGGPSEANGPQSTNKWNGFFSISSYTQYFDVDTDIVLNRLLTSLNPTGGDFFSKIDSNPDLYGAIWICTTLVFMLSFLGNCAKYLTEKQSSSSTSWSFDVSYFNIAACSIYIYAAVVPLGFYFSLLYLGSNANLVQFYCMWGYSLFYFLLSSFLLIIPVGILRWIIIIITGSASASFVALNLRANTEGNNNLALVVLASFVLQLGLAMFIKFWFFP